MAGLQVRLEQRFIDWDGFQSHYLKMPWDEWAKLNGTRAVNFAWARYLEIEGGAGLEKELDAEGEKLSVEEWERPDTDETTDGSGADAGKAGGQGRRAKSSTAPQEEALENGSEDHQDYTAVLEQASEHGLDEPAFLEKVINQKSWADFERLGGNAEIAEKRLDAWVEKEKV